MFYTDKVVLITGGARRVGRALVCAFHDHGAQIALHYHQSTKEVTALVEELNQKRPHSVHPFAADLASAAQIESLLLATHKHFGRLDVLVNNAAIFEKDAKGDDTAWQSQMAINFQAPWRLARGAMAHLQNARGAILNVTDIHATRPLKDYILYCASKAGLVSLTRGLAQELGPLVRVNAVAPGAIAWPEDGSFSESDKKHVIRSIPLGRLGSTDDVAQAALFLCSAVYITGQILAVDGGRSLYI